MLAEYGPLLSAVGFDPGLFDDGGMFLIAGAIIRDPLLTILAVNEKLEAGRLPAGARLEIISGMSEQERLALRQRVIDGNSWLAEKLAPRKPKHGPAVTAF